MPDAERTRHAGADEWDDLFGRIGVYLGVHGVSRKRRVAIHATRLAKQHNWPVLLFVRRQDSRRWIFRVGRADSGWWSRSTHAPVKSPREADGRRMSGGQGPTTIRASVASRSMVEATSVL